MSCLYACTGGADKNIRQTENQTVQFSQSEKQSGSDDAGFFRSLFDKFKYPFALTSSGRNDAKLTKGVYEIEGIIGNESAVAGTFRNREISIPINGEPKKVYVRKLVIKEPSEIDGRKGSQYKAIIEVLENPLPIAPIIYGLSAVGSLTAGWFFVDKVEKFSTTGAGTLLTVAVSVIAIYKFVIK